MSWISTLFETYENCVSDKRLQDSGRVPLPVGHTVQQAHIEIRIDADGNFLGARPVDREQTVIPATEQSAGRTSGAAPHPLADKIQYCGGDYKSFGGKKELYFEKYKEGLAKWVNSEFVHPKAVAVWKYVSKSCLVRDLVAQGLLKVDSANQLLTSWPAEDTETPHLFKVLTKKKEKGGVVQDQGDAMVRWIVEIAGDNYPCTWEDPELIRAWCEFDASSISQRGFCFVRGKIDLTASQHPAKIRHLGDKAKLISSNDSSGFTFRGKFTVDDSSQACSIGYAVTQKAHSALRWLIERQCVGVNGDQVYVAWALHGAAVPHPLINSLELFGIEHDGEAAEAPTVGDLGQAFAQRLKKAISGYAANLDANETIVVMGLDSATPGRMAIIHYQELRGSDFFARINDWHYSFAWSQPIFVKLTGEKGKRSRKVWKTYAPAPREIAEAAYGKRLDDALKKACVERLLPCIVDGRPFPIDLVRRLSERAANRAGFAQDWEWEEVFGIACAVFRGFSMRHPEINKREEYSMTLDVNRVSRDYLFGRLLAYAENLENYALYLGGEQRETNAARLMQRFSDRPASTWLVLTKQLVPYRSRLQARRPGVLAKLLSEMDEVVSKFDPAEFSSDRKLSAEFLLGYHCQRQEFRSRRERAENSTESEVNEGEIA